jgi:hypothetical protein
MTSVLRLGVNAETSSASHFTLPGLDWAPLVKPTVTAPVGPCRVTCAPLFERSVW